MIGPSSTAHRLTRRLQMQGLVQGQGIRPAVARLAFEFGLGGNVDNSACGVEIHAIGDQESVDAFELALRERFNAEVVRCPLENVGCETAEFRILPSDDGG